MSVGELGIPMLPDLLFMVVLRNFFTKIFSYGWSAKNSHHALLFNWI